MTNSPDDILSAWTALEVLSPPAFGRPEQLAAGNRAAVASLLDRELPWERGEKSRPNCRLYYQIVLGTVRIEKAVSRLIEKFGDSRPDFPNSKGSAILGVVIVDKEGRLAEANAVSVASFGWGAMAALDGGLAGLARWPEIEPKLMRSVERELLRFGEGETEEERRKAPVSREAISAAFAALVREARLPADLVDPPAFAIRTYEYYRNANPPEPLLLNSFFLGDLAMGRALLKEKRLPGNLKRYLGISAPKKRVDLLRDNAALEAAAAPRMTPLAKWPAPGGHSPALLQQAAVNLAFAETRAGGMIGINGPPGTGKTTLLRDIIAGNVASRAEAMCQFEDPETAFMRSGQRTRAGDAWLHLHELDSRLRDFEMVVASSNNKAVENVSREIPDVSSIASDAGDLRYFKALSDKIHGRETWGLIAAVLGNSANRWEFKNAFWWDEDVSMNSYLMAAAGGAPREPTDAPAGPSAVPKTVLDENPPKHHEEAVTRWQAARKEFRSAVERSRKSQVLLEAVRESMIRLDSLRAAESAAREEAAACEAGVQAATGSLRTADEKHSASAQELSEADGALKQNGAARPWFWERLLFTSRALAWSAARKALRAAHEAARRAFLSDGEARESARRSLEFAAERQARAAAASDYASTERTKEEAHLSESQKLHGLTLPDSEFFAREHAKRHLATPWYAAEAQRVREDLFISAMRLHRAFIDAAARPIRSNLGALMNAFSGSALQGKDKEALLPHLWSTLFLVVPVVSTTFASVGRMLGKLPPESLGWLLIDEAGQALPQAAVGALIRSRRAVVVGDPAQIEPVVVLPDQLTCAISRSFGVDPDIYSAPAASVQTLADAASSFSTEFQTKLGTRNVGVPLLVHRRCGEPMFGISNMVAYSGLMVQAKRPKPSPLRDRLGPSRWIHVEGSGEDKWCDEEGAEVLRLLRILVEGGLRPDIYVVTPFVIVADRMRQLVRDSGVLDGLLDAQKVHEWTYERIGTVHSVQGREAEAVIFVLGAPGPNQAGARGWAGSRPNLLNVAITRAQETLYIIGNRDLWQNAGHFADLDAYLRS